jgi:RND family efflux transporter MFP subunit
MVQDKAALLRSLRIDAPAAAQRTARGGDSRRALMLGIGGTLLAVVLLGGAYAVFSGGNSKPAATTSPATTAVPAPSVAPTPIENGGLIASGFVVARRKATVAAEISGKVIELPIEEGMRVEQGQILARLDSVLADADLATTKSRALSAEAAVASYEADLRDAEKTRDRTRTLRGQGFASEADMIRADSRFDSLRGALNKARADLETARRSVERDTRFVDKYTIRAPYAGIVVDRQAQPGEIISPSSAGGGFTRTGICTIVDMDSIEVEVDVNEAFIGRVVPDQRAEAILDAYPNWQIPASVIAIVPTANREKATVKVRLRLEQKDPRILPDMAVKVSFRDASKDAQKELTKGKGG